MATDRERVRYGTFSMRWMAAVKMEVLVMVGGFFVDGSNESIVLNFDSYV
jgi:hypothetical protein